MKIHFEEQDVIDSVCVSIANEQRCDPEDFDVDLQFNRAFGFSAEAKRGFHHYRLHEQQIVDAVVFYLAEYHSFLPDRLRVDLMFNEHTGIEADILIL